MLNGLQNLINKTTLPRRLPGTSRPEGQLEVCSSVSVLFVSMSIKSKVYRKFGL